MAAEKKYERRITKGKFTRPRGSPNQQRAGPETGGLLPNSDCWGIDQPGSRYKSPKKATLPPAGYKEFGWPCAIGGSVSITQTTADTHGPPVNCLVFYLPAKRRSADAMSVWAMIGHFKAALRTAIQQQPRLLDPASDQRIGLVNLAFDIDELFVKASLPDQIKEMRERIGQVSEKVQNSRVRLRGIAIVPSRTDRITHAVASDECGLWSPEGLIVVERIPVSLGLDLNRPPSEDEVDSFFLHVFTVPSFWQGDP